jgi:hypothetical protein
MHVALHSHEARDPVAGVRTLAHDLQPTAHNACSAGCVLLCVAEHVRA